MTKFSVMRKIRGELVVKQSISYLSTKCVFLQYTAEELCRRIYENIYIFPKFVINPIRRKITNWNFENSTNVLFDHALLQLETCMCILLLKNDSQIYICL